MLMNYDIRILGQLNNRIMDMIEILLKILQYFLKMISLQSGLPSSVVRSLD